MAVSGQAHPTSSPAFEQLLAAFDPDRELAGVRYRDLHHRLVKFFEWQCSHRPDEQADKVIDRMMAKIAQGERIENPPAYARGVARLLLREAWKEAAREEQVLAQMPRVVVSGTADPVGALLEDDDPERQQACLDHCLETLTPRNREIILGYYSGERRARIELRRQLAARLGTELGALHVRAHRIRALLEECVWKCIG
jgi:DNA-directed RNA polymerase specialized sigma24 family protein